MTKRTKADQPTEAAAIDARSAAVVLRYVGPGIQHGVPTRDLHGGDLNRIVFVRAHAGVAWEKPGATRPPTVAAAEALEALADELVATGAYARDVPHGTTTDEPAGPATTDEPAAPAEG